MEASASYLSTIKHHRPVDEEGGEELLAPAHIDCSLLTIIYNPHCGLQVRISDANDGQWVDIPPASVGACRPVVLVGAELERATGGALKAMEHRVVKSKGFASMPHQSLVFHLRACHTAMLAPLNLAHKQVR